MPTIITLQLKIDPDAWPALPRGVVRLVAFTAPALLVLSAIAELVR